MINLSSQHLRSILALLQKKEDFLAELTAINADITAALFTSKLPPAPAIARPMPAKKPAKKPPVKTAKPGTLAPAGKNEGSLMSQIVSILKPAGEEGLTIPEMAEKLNVPESDIDALIRPFSKKPGQKSKKPAKSTKRGPQPGGKPGATKARILALLETAGSKGLTIKEVAEKLNLSRAGVSVWFGKTGKNLTTRLAPGCYALKS